MEITVEWDNSEKTIIRQVYSPTWDWGEYLASFERIERLAAEVDHRVSIIAEAGAIKSIPPNALMYGSRAIGNLPPNVDVYVVVTPSRLSLAIINVIRKLTRQNMQVAATVAAARTLIEASSNTLRPKSNRDDNSLN